MSTSENYQNDQILSFLTATAVVKKLGAKLVAGRKIDESSVAGSFSPGVIMDTETSVGKDVGVLTGPCFVKITSGAAFSDLDNLAVDAAGKFRTATAGQIVVAIAMEAASGADKEALVLLLAPSQFRVASANITPLTDNTGGTASDTLADVPAAYTEATLANQLASLAAKINSIITALDQQGITL